MEDKVSGVFGSLRGIVQSVEQKSGLNPLLFLDAIFGIPGIIGYAWSGKSILLCFVWIPLIVTCVFYALAFAFDRNFLRSEKHVYDMKQLDILGEKDKEITGSKILEIPSTVNPKPKNDRKLGRGK